MRVVKALSLILLCAASVRVAIAQAGAKENAEAAPQARRDEVITGRADPRDQVRRQDHERHSNSDRR
jgi:hypothetical protein